MTVEKEQNELEIFEIISHGGNARSLSYEALDAAENGDFEKAADILKEAEAEMLEAHHTQTSLIQAELNDKPVAKSLLMIHAQDHLMTAIAEKNLVERMIKLYKRLEEK